MSGRPLSLSTVLNLRSGPILAVLIHSLLRAPAGVSCNIQIQPRLKAKLSCNAKRRRQCRRTVKNNSRSNQQKKQLFLYIFLPSFCTTTTRNFQRLFHGGNVVRFLIDFFSFSPCIGGRQHFSFCHRSYKIFMLFLQQKMSPLFLSLALDLCRPACCPFSTYSLFFSVFLLFYIPNLWT